MFSRTMKEKLLRMAKQYPVVTITGPRQSGKTTLVKEAFPNKPYVNLEALHIQELALLDPVHFLEQYPSGAIFDEIQRVPSLLSYIQVCVDEKNQKGMFILTGSHQLKLHEAISQSLAGRTALLRLLPMALEELEAAGFTDTIDSTILKGGFPRIYESNLDAYEFYDIYVQTYLERDLRNLLHIKDLHLFTKFLKLSSGRIGQIFNKDHLAQEVGVSAKTISEWVSVLEASYIIFLLPPFYENFGKRAIKSPKLYFSDVGLAAFLLGIQDVAQFERDPLRGSLIENLVILEIIKSCFNKGRPTQLYFYRDQKIEIDLLYQKGHALIPIEIKAAKTFNSSFLQGILSFEQLVKERASKSYLIYTGDKEQSIRNTSLISYKNASLTVAD